MAEKLILGPFGEIWTGIIVRDGKWDEASPGSACIMLSVGMDVPNKEEFARQIVDAHNARFVPDLDGETLVSRLQRLMTRLDADGFYVDANIVAAALDELRSA